MIGAMLCYGLVPLGENLATGLQGLLRVFGQESLDTLGVLHAFALSAAALLSAHLVFTLWLTYFRIQRQRRRHRDLLNVLSSPSSDRPRTLVINHQAPVAYCLPGGSRSVTVLSEGLLELLSPRNCVLCCCTNKPIWPSVTICCCGPLPHGALRCRGCPPQNLRSKRCLR